MRNLKKFRDVLDERSFSLILKEKASILYKGFVENISSLFSILCVCSIFLSIVILISFSFTLAGSDSYSKTMAYSIVHLIFPDLEQGEYNKVLSSGIALSTVVVSLLPSVSSLNEITKFKKKVNMSAPIEKKSVGMEEGPDLKVMLDFYKIADKVIVLSGGFSWLPKNEELKSVILKLSEEKKISLVSYRAEEDVKKQVVQEDLFENLKENFIFNSGKRGAKCSLVETKNELVFLYRDGNPHTKKGYVCIVRDESEGKSLLRTIHDLLLEYDPDNPQRKE